MTPPRVASALLRLCAHRRDRTFVEQDLADEFARIAAGRGTRAARAWYRRQVAGSLVPLVVERLRLSWPALPRGAPLGRDAIQAFRSLTRNAGLSMTILATLVVGLTTTLAAALLLYGVVLRPLPYDEPDQLVAVRPWGPRLPAAVRSISLPDLEDWQQTPRSFAALSGFSDLTFTLTGLGDPRRVDGLRVGPRFGEVVRTRPILGRPFEPRDFVQGSQYVTLLGHALWQRDFGGDPGAVGRSLTLDGRRYEIVGVLPDLPFRDITEQHEFWVPLVPRPGVTWEPVRGNGFVSVLARLAPGTTLRAAQEELSSVAATLAERYPQSNADKPAVLLEPLHDAIVKDVRRPLLLVFAAVGSVLLVACGNLVNLLLAHAERRRHEFAVRLALGAGSGRIRRQVLLEVAAIVTVAMAVSLIMAPALARLFTTLYPTPLPSSEALGITTRALAGALALGVVVTVLLAWPQMRRASPSITAGGTVRVTGSRNDRRGRAALIAVQVAFTLVLAFAGVALLRSIARLAAIEPGIDAAGVVAFSVSPSSDRYPSAAATKTFFEQLLGDIRALPGVRSAAVSTAVPFVNQGWGFAMTPPDGGARRIVRVTIASPGFFETLRVRLLKGRLLSESEHGSEQRVMVVNDITAKLLPYADPVGRTLRYSGIEWTVVGVVAPVVQVGLRTPAAAEVFLPWSQAGRAPQRIIVDIDGSRSAVLSLITARVRALDPMAPVADVMPIEDRVAASVASDRFSAALLSALAIIGVLLAALGVWSVTSYVVARQERENGIRAALGESRPRQFTRTMQGTARPALLGVGLGVVLCVWLAPVLEALLFQVRPRDPLTVAIAAAAVIVTALAAALVPALRALRVSPAAALRAN